MLAPEEASDRSGKRNEPHKLQCLRPGFWVGEKPKSGLNCLIQRHTIHPRMNTNLSLRNDYDDGEDEEDEEGRKEGQGIPPGSERRGLHTEE